MRSATDCPDTEILARFMLGELPAREFELLERHLVQCSRCDELADSLGGQDTLTDAMRARSPIAAAAQSPEVEALIRTMRALTAEAWKAAPAAGETPADSPFRSAPAIDVSAEAMALLEPPRGPGEIGRFGPYAILKVIGSGGMGVVYQAVQPRPQRLVALKVSLVDFRAGRQRLARSQSEPEIVARLEHATIVPIYEAGEHAGLPYFTMEYLEGGSLGQRLSAAPLPAREAAGLVQALAGAVQFAHQHGVVHRDLKPSNVLLTSDGLPKISDFGLAKVVELEAQVAERQDYLVIGAETQTGAVLGTPAYMAPEQATGHSKEAGPAVDVYALGAILYEAVTGRPPFKAATVLETLEQVRSQEPVPPCRLQPALPHDLQTICLKCLEKEPRRRYASARELADDLGRFQRREPIRARPVSALERLRKWLRRKPALAALVFVSVLSLAALVAGSLVYNGWLRAAVTQAEDSAAESAQQRQRADAGYRAARATLDRMLGRLETPALGEVPRVKELQGRLLEDALAFYEGALKDADNSDPAVRLDTARACQRAATIQQLLGRPKDAVQNYRRAIDLVDSLPAEERDAPAGQSVLAHCHDHLGLVANDAARWDEALEHHRKALDINQRLVQAQPNDPGSLNGVAQSEHYLGVVYQLTKKVDKAEAHYARAVAIRARLVHDHPKEERYQAALGGNYINLALLHQNYRPTAAVTPNYEKAEALLRPLVARYPPGGENALLLAAAYINWGYHLRAKGRVEDAIAKQTEAVDLAEAALRQEPRHFIARARAFNAHGARAQTLDSLSRFADAVKDWDRVVELDETPNAWVHRALRMLALARAGEHARAVAEVKALEQEPKVSADRLFELARGCALSMAAANSDNRLSAAERAALAERYGSQAVALLQKLEDQGYFRDAGHAQALRTDPDLRPLRDREDFRRLLPATKGEKQEQQGKMP